MPNTFPISNLAELERPALETALAERGHDRFRARQIFNWMYRRGVTDSAEMTDLPRSLRTELDRTRSRDDPGHGWT